MTERTYVVPGMSCAHCKHAVVETVSGLTGVESVDVNLEDKRVVVQGDALDDAAVRAAIAAAGYEALP